MSYVTGILLYAAYRNHLFFVCRHKIISYTTRRGVIRWKLRSQNSQQQKLTSLLFAWFSFSDINRLLNAFNTSASTDANAVPPEPRIVILSVSPDLSTSYIPLMNSIFSAQKLVCQLFSHFLVISASVSFISTKYACIVLISDIMTHLKMAYQLESNSRRMQVIRLRGSVSATSCPSYWGVIHCSRKTRLVVNTSSGTLFFCSPPKYLRTLINIHN